MATVLLASFGFAQQTQPTGALDWKLNVDKSKADPGPPPKSGTPRIESAAGGKEKHTIGGANADGQMNRSERVAKYNQVISSNACT